MVIRVFDFAVLDPSLYFVTGNFSLVSGNVQRSLYNCQYHLFLPHPGIDNTTFNHLANHIAIC